MMLHLNNIIPSLKNYVSSVEEYRFIWIGSYFLWSVVHCRLIFTCYMIYESEPTHVAPYASPCVDRTYCQPHRDKAVGGAWAGGGGGNGRAVITAHQVTNKQSLLSLIGTGIYDVMRWYGDWLPWEEDQGEG